MNATIETEIRKMIKDLLIQCPEDQQQFFIRIFSHDNPEISLDEAINKVPSDKLDSAFSLCERTIERNKQK